MENFRDSKTNPTEMKLATLVGKFQLWLKFSPLMCTAENVSLV